jgi:magnesium transporter
MARPAGENNNKRRQRKTRAALASEWRSPPGSPPGVIRGAPTANPSAVHAMAYGADWCAESRPNPTLDDIEKLRNEAGCAVLWVNVDGLGDHALIEGLGRLFGLHSLALEDVVHVHQRPKVEEYDDHTFIVLRTSNQETTLELEQFSIFVGANFVVTLQERSGDCLGPVRERIRKSGTRLRAQGAGYLAYAIIDALVDHFFPLLEHYLEKLESLEASVLGSPSQSVVQQLYAVRSELHTLRRVLWPTRDVASTLAHGDSAWFSPETSVYLRDCYDHSVQLIDLLEDCREMTVSLMDLYLASSNQRMSEVMKVLTIIATVFMPLSFIAGVYGMNFDREASAWNMPELGWPFGYLAVLGLMGSIGGSMVVFFWKKGWLSGPK